MWCGHDQRSGRISLSPGLELCSERGFLFLRVPRSRFSFFALAALSRFSVLALADSLRLARQSFPLALRGLLRCCLFAGFCTMLLFGANVLEGGVPLPQQGLDAWVARSERQRFVQ